MKFAVPGLASAIVGAALGALLIVVVTLSLQQTSRPHVDRSGGASSALLNNVEYGSR
jgi:hypothetical protein